MTMKNTATPEVFETLWGRFEKGTPEYEQMRQDIERQQNGNRAAKRALRPRPQPKRPPFFETLEGTFLRGTPEYEKIASAIAAQDAHDKEKRRQQKKHGRKPRRVRR